MSLLAVIWIVVAVIGVVTVVGVWCEPPRMCPKCGDATRSIRHGMVYQVVFGHYECCADDCDWQERWTA